MNTMKSPLRSFRLLVLSLAVVAACLTWMQEARATLVFAEAMAGGGDVKLDFTNFELRLANTAAVGGKPNFTAPEVATIKSGIITKLETMYADFDMTFVEGIAGATEPTVTFGETAAPGFLGEADHIDFLNMDPADTARVYSGNFGFIIDGINETVPLTRPAQIAQLTAALAGTAGHEVAHNLGLRHHDAYSNSTFTGTPIVTTGDQNMRVMSTGSTGLNEAEREVDRTFSRNSLVKLAYAAGTLPTNPSAISETAAPNDTTGTAMVLSPDTLTIAGGFLSKVVQGDLSSIVDVDVFAFPGVAGTLLTADMNNDYFSGSTATDANTFLEVIGPDGSTVLASSSSSRYSGDSYGGASGSGDAFDPAVFNVPIATTGTYYVRVTGEDLTFGSDYTLLIHATAVPEPSAFAFLGLLGVMVTSVKYIRNRRETSDA